MSDSKELETTDVVVVGCGPVGGILSALLGQLGVKNVVLERETEVASDPRAITLDEDGIRVLQAVGLYGKVYTEIGSCLGIFNFISGAGHDLGEKPFMAIDNRTSEGPTGHVFYIGHRQPILEKNIRSAMAQESSCELRGGATVTAISEDADWVYVTYTSSAGEHKLRSKFLVGADGGRGFVRKQYLEPRGVKMEQSSEAHYDETWVALNWKLTLPTPETHPKFPLWSSGYTPEQVYDLFFPPDFRFLCNPERPAVCGRFGLPEDRHWRFEFVVLEGEDGNLMASPEMIDKIVMPYVEHLGSRYGLQGTITYPRDCIEILRSRPFNFSARTCNKWAVGRVMLIGDAAHVFPPFGGQGLASGFRDASSLAWRLAVALKPGADHEQLLQAWYAERKQQLVRSLALTIRNGQYVTERNWLKAQLRDWTLYAMQLTPSGKRSVESAGRGARGARYDYEPHMPFEPTSGGFLLPQVYCARISADAAETPKVQFTDDIIFSPQKRALFQIVVLLKSIDDYKRARHALRNLPGLSHGALVREEATYILQDTYYNHNTIPKDADPIYRLATGEEFAKDPVLCAGRPEPMYYDTYRITKEVDGKSFVIVRPDRFVFAACKDEEELLRAARLVSRYVRPMHSERLGKL